MTVNLSRTVASGTFREAVGSASEEEQCARTLRLAGRHLPLPLPPPPEGKTCPRRIHSSLRKPQTAPQGWPGQAWPKSERRREGGGTCC